MEQKLLRFLFLFLAATLTLFAKEPLKVGMELTYPPFEMIDKKGKPAGISVDMAQALADYLNKELVVDNIPFIGLIPALKSEKIDLILSSMTMTEERKQSIDFSEPYIQTGLCLLIAKDSPIQNIEDANQKGRVIVVKIGTTGQVYAENNLKNATVHILDKEASCVLEVVQGKADAFIYDQMSTYTNWQKNKNTTRALLTPFKKEYWAFGIRKGNDVLREKVNAFLKEFRANGGFDKLGDKYLNDQKEAFKKMGIPFYF